MSLVSVCVQLLFDQRIISALGISPRQRVKEAGPLCLRSNKEGERRPRFGESLDSLNNVTIL